MQCHLDTRRTRVLTAGTIIAIIITGSTLAGCSGSGASSSASSAVAAADSGSAPAAAGAPAASPAAGSTAGVAFGPATARGAGGSSGSGSGVPGGTGQSATAARLAVTGQQIIYTAQLSMRARDVSSAVAQATQVVGQAGGYVSAENATSDPDHPASATATITFKVPVAAYQATLATLASGALGTRLSLRQQAQDVTEQVADVASQVASDEAAIAQLRALLRHAGSVGDLLQVQGQINSEESDLEAMEAQQRALNHETSYATVTVTIVGPKAVPPRHRPKEAAPPPGLASGAAGGWHAFKLTIDWLLAIAGAVAPFAAALAVLAALAWYVRRRLRRSRPPAPGPSPAE